MAHDYSYIEHSFLNENFILYFTLVEKKTIANVEEKNEKIAFIDFSSTQRNPHSECYFSKEIQRRWSQSEMSWSEGRLEWPLQRSCIWTSMEQTKNDGNTRGCRKAGFFNDLDGE